MEEEKINSIEEKKKNAFLCFLWKHKTIVAFIVIVGGVLLYFNFKISSSESSHREELNSTIENYTLQIDSLQTASAKTNGKSFFLGCTKRVDTKQYRTGK